MSNKLKKVDYVVHWVTDYDPKTKKQISKKREFINGMCNAHTHGLDKYGSHELQIVIDAPDAYSFLFEKIARQIASGQLKLEDGMILKGMFSDGADLRVDKHLQYINGYTEKPEYVWRLIIPDGEFKMPEESEEVPYCFQTLEPTRDYWKTVYELEGKEWLEDWD